MENAEFETRDDPSKGASGMKSRLSKALGVLGRDVPRSDVVFLSQMFIICIIVTASIYNLSVGDEKGSLWIALLTSSCSYLIPPPFQLRKKI